MANHGLQYNSIKMVPIKIPVQFEFHKHHDYGSVSTIDAYAFGIVHDCSRNLSWLPYTSDKISTSGNASTHSFLVGGHNDLVNWP